MRIVLLSMTLNLFDHLLSNDHRTHNFFCDVEDTVELSRELRLAGELNEDVVTLCHVIDSVSKTALAPLVDRCDLAVLADQGCELLNGRSDSLFADCGVDDEKNLVVIIFIILHPPYCVLYYIT